MGAVFIIFAGLFGLVIGSFINVLIVRVPKELSIVSPGSHCPACSHKLNWYDNIPLISYILLKGKCRYCKCKISVMYPITECVTSFLFIMLYIYFGLTLDFFKYVLFVFLIITISFTDIYTSMQEDFETGMIPVVYIVAGIISALIYAVYEGKFLYSLAGISAGYLVLFIPAYLYSIVRKREGMGEGDFMLFAMIGGFLGAGAIPAVLLISSVIGIITGIVIVICTKNKEYPMPFAPMLSAGAVIYIFFQDIFDMYMVSNQFIIK